MFTVTDSAVKQIQTARKQSNADGLYLRVAARFTEDKSIEYTMGFDEQKDNDEAVRFDDVMIVIDQNSQGLLEDCTLDFVELEPEKFEFIFLNPLDPGYVPPEGSKKPRK